MVASYVHLELKRNHLYRLSCTVYSSVKYVGVSVSGREFHEGHGLSFWPSASQKMTNPEALVALMPCSHSHTASTDFTVFSSASFLLIWVLQCRIGLHDCCYFSQKNNSAKVFFWPLFPQSHCCIRPLQTWFDFCIH